jgi:hypothetical protein
MLLHQAGFVVHNRALLTMMPFCLLSAMPLSMGGATVWCT